MRRFRMVGSRMRVYWLDADGRVIEPQSPSGGMPISQAYPWSEGFPLQPVGGNVALGHPESIPYPHIFNLVLNLQDADSGA